MKAIYWLYLLLIIPAYLLFLTFQQYNVYQGLTQTYEAGTSYLADVEEFEIKHIASQTNGYVIVSFTPKEGEKVERKLSLPVQLAAKVMDSRIIPVRYLPQSSQPIVMVSTYESHRHIVLVNMGITFLSFLITSLLGWWLHRYIQRRAKESATNQDLIIERVDE